MTDRVRHDPRSRDGTLFGMTRGNAFAAIGGGQADFDTPDGNVESDDLALLYAYLNQKGHLEELLAAFSQLFAQSVPDDPIVVDIGCGPFTGGLAVAAALGDKSRFDYIGVDRACSMRQLGSTLAASKHLPGHVKTHWASDIRSIEWPTPPSWREVIVVISYLFASPSLDAEKMFGDLNSLLDILGHGGVTLLYTNSTNERYNVQYPSFRNLLLDSGFDAHADDRGEILIGRYSGTIKRELNYALFRRPPRHTLAIGK